MMKSYKRALSIAGFDGSGGAGIQADLKTFSALGCYGMNVLTSLPVQNTTGVKSIYPIPKKSIMEQCESIFDDIGTDAVKIGMLHNTEIILAIFDQINKYLPSNIVVDPVFVAKSGDYLLEKDSIDVMVKYILPLAKVLTPNIFEAETLLNTSIVSEEEMKIAAKKLSMFGPEVVIIKGGHRKDKSARDCVYFTKEKRYIWLDGVYVDTKNTHGTGCTFSSAITSFLALGYELENAIRKAKKYISEAIFEGSKFSIGKGNGPLHHFYNLWKYLK